MNYLVREPENIHAQTPILVLLHGYGSDEKDLFSFTPDLPKDWLIVSFQAPYTTPNGGFSWYDIDLLDREKFINVPQAEESIELILNTIEEIKEKYKTNGVVNLCGFSQGGILSYALALRFPQLFQKIACLSAYPEQKIIKNLLDRKVYQHLFFFVSHGVNDMVIPLEWGKKGVELLYDLSIFFSFREYQSSHGVDARNYMDLMEFFKK